MSQSFTDFDYLVVDDGSRDDTRDVVKSFGSAVGYVYHDNLGEAASTNRGWRLAKGKYFAMVSSDDPMLRDWLSCAVSFMESHPNVLVAYPDWVMIDERGQALREVRVPDFTPEALFGWFHCLPGPGALIRRAPLGSQYPLRSIAHRYLSDMESWMRLALIGDFARIPETLAQWRFHEDSVSVADSTLERSRETIDLAESFFEMPGLSDDVKRFQALARSRAYYLAAVFVRSSHPVRAFGYFVKSLSIGAPDPDDMPASLKRLTPAQLLARICSSRP